MCHIIYKFVRIEDAESWWGRFCNHRGSQFKSMGRGEGVDKDKIARMEKDAVTSGYEPK